MPIYQAGNLNPAALSAPDVYVQVVPPKTRYINGVPTDGLGLVGVASWGPVNSAFRIRSDTDAAFFLGTPVNRKYDLSTAVSISLQVGASNLTCVRVTNGRDTAARGVIRLDKSKTALQLKARYTGSRGNSIQALISPGTAVSSHRLTVSLPGLSAETFDNIKGEGKALYQAMADAISHGQLNIRGPSQLVKAQAIETEEPAPNDSAIESVTLTGGTDGATGIDDAVILGKETGSSTREGLYALRGTHVQVINLVDVTDSANWPAMAALAASEGAFTIAQGAASADSQRMSELLKESGVDDWHFKLLVGDWPYWKDATNGINRMIAPATFEAANIAARSPHISTLNKRIPGIIATQRQLEGRPYSVPEIGHINSSRLDVITNPCPGGNYFGMRSGRNSCSVPTQNDDTYTRMTNYLAMTLAASFGVVVGDNQTEDLRRETKSTLESFLSNLETLKMIGNPNGGPAFAVRLDETNNPDSRVALGYMTADVQVKYLNVVRFFLVNLEGGGSVSISVSNH